MAISATAALMMSGCTAGTDSTTPQVGDDGAAPETVTVGLPLAVSTYDPAVAIQESDVMAQALIGGTLTRATDDGFAFELASECDFDDAATTYTCSLRDDAKFSDGSAVTAADVVATFERLLASETNVNAGLISNVQTVQAIDAATVSFVLAAPQASFPLALSQGPLGIYPAASVDDPAFFNAPVVAGQYVPSQLEGTTATFTRNENYPAELAPVVETVVFDNVTDPSTRLAQLNSGQIDVAHSISPNQLTQVTAPAQPEVTAQFGGIYIYMNNEVAALQDPNVRKAISLAVDREQLNAVAFGGENTAIGGFFPSVMEGYDESATTDRDLEAAEALLADSACSDGCEIELMVRAGYAPYDAMATVVQQNLAEVGIDVQLRSVDQATANNDEINGNFEMEIGNLYDTVNAPELIMLTYGLTNAGGIRSLFSGYSNPDVDALAVELAAATGDERDAILQQINEAFAADLPFVPLLDAGTAWASRVNPDIIAFTASGTYKVEAEGHGIGE